MFVIFGFIVLKRMFPFASILHNISLV